VTPVLLVRSLVVHVILPKALGSISVEIDLRLRVFSPPARGGK